MLKKQTGEVVHNNNNIQNEKLNNASGEFGNRLRNDVINYGHNALPESPKM